MKKTIALAMIVKNDSPEIDGALKAIKSVEKYVDNIYITLNDKEGVKTIPKELEKYNVSTFKWIDDFSACRNFNFKQVKEDWILWLDADDILKGGENLRELVDNADDKRISGYWFMYYYQLDKNGNVEVQHWQTQLLKNDGHFEWKGAIHEVPIQLRPVNWARVPQNKIARVHLSDAVESIKKKLRNLEILKKEIEKQGRDCDPRLLFYFAIALQTLGKSEKAIPIIELYLEKSGWSDERYEAQQQLAHIYIGMQKFDEAKNVLLKALEESPQFPDSYYNLATIYLLEKNYSKAIEWNKLGFNKKIPDTNIVQFPGLYTWKPLMVYAEAMLNIGMLEDAQKAINAALKYNPKNEDIIKQKEVIDAVKTKNDTARAFFNIGKYLRMNGQEKFIPRLLSGVPNQLLDDPMILKLWMNYMKPRKWGDKEIAYYCPMTVEPWSPKSLKEGGIGGSETAVIKIAEGLAKHGWKVTVFNWCSTDAGEYNGVVYKNFWEFNWKDEFNKLILWRYPDIVDLKLNVKEIYLDLHDVPNPHDYTEERVKKISKIFVKSDYHRSLLPMISDDKFVIVGNGINTGLFNGSENSKRDINKYIYSSTIDRGLDILVDLWPEIRRKNPKAELYVYYGRKTFYELEKDNPERMKFMNRVVKKLNQPGIHDVGRLPQDKLAKEMMSAGYWLFPTYFPEIFCQPKGSLVFTKDGMKNIEDIKVGNLVLTHRGRFKKVINVIKKKHTGNLIGLRRKKDFNYIWFTPEHEIFIKRVNGRSDAKTGRVYSKSCKYKNWIEAERLKTNIDWLQSPKGVYGNKNKIRITDYVKHNIDRKNPRYKKFPKEIKLDTDFSYLLGYFAAEGTVSKAKKGGSLRSWYSLIGFSSHKREIKQRKKIKRILKKFNIEVLEKEVSENGIYQKAYNSILAAFLDIVIGRKKDKKIPDFIWETTLKNQKAFLRGLFDGDGYYNKKRDNLSYTTISKHLAYGIRQILINCGIYPSMAYCKSRNAFTLNWKEGSYRNCHIDFGDTIGTKLCSRKEKEFDNFVYDIEVEEDHTYICNNTIVHNCITAAECQAAGCVPIVMNYAALKEIVKNGIKIEGDIYDPDIQKEWLNALFKEINNPTIDRQKMIKEAKEIFNWEKVCEIWHENIT